jgi:diamine N-acetyltransferase
MPDNKSIQVTLRAIEPEDIDLIYSWENDKTIWEVSNTITPFSRYVLGKYIDSAHLDIYQTRQLRLMIDIINENEKKTIGAIDLFDFEPYHLRAGVGILIGDKDERNKGYADKALSELTSYVFNIMNLNQLYCNINSDNHFSIKLFKKHGFDVIGVKKQWNKSHNGFIDEIMLQCLSPNK